jgi:cytochrome b6-f complex iron-sulfur subunit
VEELAPSAIASRSRRDFVANIVMCTGAVLGLGSLAYRFLQYLYPVLPPNKLVEVPAGKSADIPSDGVRLTQLPGGPVFLQKVGNEFRAFSAICTHLGCTVQWHPEEKRFVCPCHQGIYDSNGNVLSGPPLRPLTRLQIKLRDEQVFVLMNSSPEVQG